MKLNAKKLLVISLILCLISSVGSMIFQTSFGQVEYHDMTFVTASGHELDALLLVPKTATVDNKAPAIVVSHGWYNNREMQDLNYVEYCAPISFAKTIQIMSGSSISTPPTSASVSMP